MNKTTLPPVLITSSVIAMDSSVNLKNAELRVRYTLEGLEKWLAISPKISIVICDGSGYDFSKKILEHFPEANIESLYFENDLKSIQMYGKGFGEGEIINYAIKHSKVLKSADWFCKCTAKLWVDNFFECISSWNEQFLCKAYFSNVFSFKKTRLEYIDTRFYLVNKDFYIKHFSLLHMNLDESKISSIEDQFCDAVTHPLMHGVMFTIQPVICGMGGGSGKYYNNSLARRVKERLRLMLVKNQSVYKNFFHQ